MKKFYFAILAAMLMWACTDVDEPKTGPEESQEEETIADYTVIFWGMSGTNDGGVVVDLLNLADYYVSGKIGDNVDIAGLIKTSVNLSDETAAAGYDKTFYFESGDKMTEKAFNGDVNTVSEAYDAFFKVFDGTTYADTSYPLNNPDSLASFIKRVAKEHPAHNYALMLLGHGGGFSPAEETPLTKACLYDNYTNSAYLTADAVVSAVQKSGVKVQTIFTQCCLMATLENIAAYSQVFDYGFLAAEVTYSGYFPMYLVALSEAGNDNDKMVENSDALIDYYVNLFADDPDVYTTHGFYDLTQASKLLSIVKDISSWYNTNYSKFPDPIEEAMSKCIFCDNLKPGEDSLARQKRAVIQAISAGEDVSSLFEGASSEEIFKEFVNMLIDLNYGAISYGFPFAHVLQVTLDELVGTSYTTERSALRSLATEYMQTLSGMAYIRATALPGDASSDYPYIYTSPTINIFALNEQYFKPLFGSHPRESLDALMEAYRNGDEEAYLSLMSELFAGTPFAGEVSLATAKTNYTSSVFDTQVLWSSFLEQLQFNPSVIFNPDRAQINENY